MIALDVAPWLASGATAATVARRRGRRPSRSLSAPSIQPPAVLPAVGSWPDLLDTVARHVRSGHSLASAFDRALAAHPVDGQSIHGGTTLAAAIRGTSTDRDESTVIHSLAMAHALGGPVASGLQAGVSILRERAAVQADIAVHSAQARLSARVLTSVPVAFSLWGTAFSRSFRGAVVTPAGLLAVAAGGILNVAGWASMRRIVRRVVS
jgi:tight adherence protein B